MSHPQVSSLRKKVLIFVGTLVLVSLLGSTISLYRITEVSRIITEINEVSIPLDRLLTQVSADAEVYRREFDRSLGYSHWKDPHWKPRPVPRWVEEMLESEVSKLSQLVEVSEGGQQWKDWARNLGERFIEMRALAAELQVALAAGQTARASEVYPKWVSMIEEWRNQIQWGSTEYERELREKFTAAQSRVGALRLGLEMILVVVICLSLFLLWFGERALRPLSELTRLARDITRRGLKREDKQLLPQVSLDRADEVSQLAREFHNMATALLERERDIESQTERLVESNRKLLEMGALNRGIVESIDSVLIVIGEGGKINLFNPPAEAWLRGENTTATGAIQQSDFLSWPRARELEARSPSTGSRIEPMSFGERTYSGRWIPLSDDRISDGRILVLHDITQEMQLQQRLRVAENLAAVGRMSAQVAHEIRNPLHAIGLEAEVALAAKSQADVRSALQSILEGVDRLEKITANYLKLSRLSAGKRTTFDISEAIEEALATYGPTCQAKGIRVDWRRQGKDALRLRGDRDLLVQVFGNFLKNSIQAFEESSALTSSPCIEIEMGSDPDGIFIRFEDNGPGVPSEWEARLFEPFATSKAQGTGLGLSFVKQVIEEHAGSVRYLRRAAQSARGGALFEVRLPALVSRNAEASL